jgi:putative phage-type endonuclease
MNQQEYEFHQKHLGGSDIGVLLGLNKYKTPYQLWQEKTGKTERSVENPYMKRGRMLEPIVAQFYEEETGKKLKVDGNLRTHLKYPQLGGLIDRVIDMGKPGVWEGKTASSWAIKAWNERIPMNYYVQLIHYLLITGWEYGEMSVLNVDKWILDNMPFEPDPKIFEMIINEGCGWWDKYVIKDMPPPMEAPDYKLISPVHGKKVQIFVGNIGLPEKISQYKERIKTLETEMEGLENQLKENIGDADVLVQDERVLATWKETETKRFDAERFKNDNPDIYGAYVKTTKSRRFTLK